MTTQPEPALDTPDRAREPIAALRDEAAARFGPTADLVVPGIRELSASFAYEQVWSRPGLSTRDRSVVTIAALVALGCTDQLRVHVLQGLANGLSKAEVAEMFTQLVPYLGFPLVVSAAAAVADVVERADDSASVVPVAGSAMVDCSSAVVAADHTLDLPGAHPSDGCTTVGQPATVIIS